MPCALRVHAHRHAAVAAAAGALLAAGILADQVELVAPVARDLRVVGGPAEAGRAAGVDVAIAVDAHVRLGLVALRIGRDRRREREPLRVGARRHGLGVAALVLKVSWPV